MSSSIHVDNLSTTASINHHDIDLALPANLNSVLNHMSVDVLDSTAAATPYMFNPPHFSRQSSSTTATTTASTSSTASNSDHLLPYSTNDFTPSATAGAPPKQTLFSFSSSSTPASTVATASSGHFTQNHTQSAQSHSNGVSLLTTGGEAQVPKTVVVDNLLEKVLRTTQDARDAFAQSRSQDGKQRLAELKAVVDLVISFVSTPVSSKLSPPGLKPITSFMNDPHSNSYPNSHSLPSHSHPHSHSTHHHHPYHFQPPSQRVSPTGVKKASSSHSRKSSLTGTVPQLMPSLPLTTTAGSTSALEDGPRKRCASPQNDRVVKSLKREPKEESLLVSSLTASTVPTTTASVATATAASFVGGAPSSSPSSGSASVATPIPVPPSAPPLLPVQPAIPPQFVHSNSYPSASGFHPHSHMHAHQHSRPHGLAPLTRISSHPNLESLSSNLNLCASSSSNAGNSNSTSVSNAAMAHQLNLMQQQQHHQIPLSLGHPHSLSTSQIPNVHSSFMSTPSTMNDEPSEASADSSVLQSPIPVASMTASTTTPPTAATTTTTTTSTSPANHHTRFHLLHPNTSLSTLPLSHAVPPLTRPTRSASHSGALSFSSFDLLSSAGNSDTATSTNTNASTPAAATSVTEVDLTGVGIGVGSVVAGSGTISSGIDVLPPPPSISTNSSTPDSEREDSPSRPHGGCSGSGHNTESGNTVSGRATDSFSAAHQNNDLSPELKAEVDRIFFEFMDMVCSDLDAKDNKGEPIHQPLMAKKMQRLDESRDFRPFKFRIQAFTNGFLEELAKQGLTDEFIPMKKVRHYLWTNPYISRFNEDGKKAKSKGNHIWNIDARKRTPADNAVTTTTSSNTTGSGGEVGAAAGGQWVFRPFKRKIAGTFPNIAYIGMQWQFRPRVWDPQASRSNLHHNNSHHAHHQQTTCFTSPSLPSWLSWNENGDTLSGTPGPDAQSVEFIIEAKEGKETILSQTYFLSVAPLTRESSVSFHSSSGMPVSAQGPRRPSIANEIRVTDTSTPLRSTRPVAPTTSAPATLQDALTVVTEAIKAVSLEAYTVQASTHAEQVQIQHSLTRQEQVLTSTAYALNQVMTIASGQHSPSSGPEHGGSGGGGDEFVETLAEAKEMHQSQIAEAASLARAGADVVICAAQKVAADHHRSAAATIFQMTTTNSVMSNMSVSELSDLQSLNTPVVTMEEVSTTTKTAVAEAVEMTDTTASPIDVMLTAETIIQQNTQPIAVPVSVPPLLATTAAPVVPSPYSLVPHGHGVGVNVNVGVVPMPPNSLASSFQDVDMSAFQVDYAMNDITSS